MQAALSVFLITLALGQLISTHWGLRGASLVGPSRLAGYGLGALLLVAGALILPAAWTVLWWTFPAGLLAVILLLLGGSFIAPPPHPDRLFTPDHPAHAGCSFVQIPDGDHLMPAVLLTPPVQPDADKELSPLAGPAEAGEKRRGSPAVCIVPGAGDTKTSFKWRLVQALLTEGLTVLTIDPPGHGDYRRRPLAYPDCLSAIPAAVEFLRKQPGVTRVGLAGISLGGALAIKAAMGETSPDPANGGSVADGSPAGPQPGLPESAGASDGARVEALAVLEAPVRLNYNRTLFYRELWHTFYGAPVLSLLREISYRQILQSWYTGGYRSQHSTAELIALLNPLENLRRVKDVPILLVYSQRDRVAPPEAARAMLQAAPQATLLESKKASHVTLTLIPEVNQTVARWLREQLQN